MYGLRISQVVHLPHNYLAVPTTQYIGTFNSEAAPPLRLMKAPEPRTVPSNLPRVVSPSEPNLVILCLDTGRVPREYRGLAPRRIQ